MKQQLTIEKKKDPLSKFLQFRFDLERRKVAMRQQLVRSRDTQLSLKQVLLSIYDLSGDVD